MQMWEAWGKSRTLHTRNRVFLSLKGGIRLEKRRRGRMPSFGGDEWDSKVEDRGLDRQMGSRR